MSCECANLDWSGVDMSQEHHPDCKVTVVVEGSYQQCAIAPSIPGTIEPVPIAAMECPVCKNPGLQLVYENGNACDLYDCNNCGTRHDGQGLRRARYAVEGNPH